MSKGNVLVVDDTLEMASTVVEFLQRHDFVASAVDSAKRGLEHFRAAPVDVVLTDLRMKDMDGLDLLRAVHDLAPDVPVIIMTAFGAVDSAVEAIQRGAYHYVTKPFKLDVVRVLIERALSERAVRAENEVLRRQVREQTSSLVGQSVAIRTVVELIHQVANSSAPVLVHGETGTGKELVAREIHGQSSRKSSPFVAVNCAALPEALLESELFGHVKGAFTGATQTRLGLFLEAHGGTLLLDEIGDMPVQLQAKLLRVLETGEIRSVGSDASRATNVRIVAATNRDLPDLVRSNKFRQDLYFRLNVLPIAIPPLRQRREDIPLLLEYFVHKSRERMSTSPVHGFRPEGTFASWRTWSIVGS
jgi:two-component system response regulator HydG